MEYSHAHTIRVCDALRNADIFLVSSHEPFFLFFFRIFILRFIFPSFHAGMYTHMGQQCSTRSLTQLGCRLMYPPKGILLDNARLFGNPRLVNELL